MLRGTGEINTSVLADVHWSSHMHMSVVDLAVIFSICPWWTWLGSSAYVRGGPSWDLHLLPGPG